MFEFLLPFVDEAEVTQEVPHEQLHTPVASAIHQRAPDRAVQDLQETCANLLGCSHSRIPLRYEPGMVRAVHVMPPRPVACQTSGPLPVLAVLLLPVHLRSS